LLFDSSPAIRTIIENEQGARVLFWRWRDQTTAVESPSRGVREAILGEELRIPEDVALIGVDHTQVTSLTGVDLTAIPQNIHRMGITDTATLSQTTLRGLPTEMVNQVIMEP